MRCIEITHPGGPEVLALVTAPDPVAGPGEVVLGVKATAVNRADLMQCLGQYPPPRGASPILGLEAAGVVTEVGPGVSGWSVGDRAMALLSGGGYAEKVAVPAGQLMRVPPGMDWIVAASVPEVYLTAWQAIDQAPRVGEGSWVLVHAGASGVGLAALDVARALGARTIATTRTQAKAEALEDAADHVLIPSPDGVSKAVVEITDGHGADLVIDLVGASYWRDTVAATAYDGRIALIGLVGGTRTEMDMAQLMVRRITVSASTLRGRPVAQKAELVARFSDWGLPLLADGTLRPRVHDMLPLRRAADAHRMLAANDTIGKVVLAVTDDGFEDA